MIAVSMTVSSVPAARDCASPFEEDAKSGNLADLEAFQCPKFEGVLLKIRFMDISKTDLRF